jgi:signal transduction histidine kinase
VAQRRLSPVRPPGATLRLIRLAARSRRASGGRDERVGVLVLMLPVALAGLAASVAAAWALAADPPDRAAVAGMLVLLVAAAFAEAFPFPIEGVTVGATSLAIVFLVAVATIYGWSGGAAVAFLTMALVEVLRRRPLSRIVYNTALYVCAAVAAGLAADLPRAAGISSLLLGALVAAPAFYLVDIALLSAIVARTARKPFVPLLIRYLYSTGAPFAIMASLTITLVALWDRSPPVAFVLVGPLIAIGLYQRWLHGALERLREFDRLKDEFIAIVSHELRTPLTSVYGAALTLQKQALDEPTREALLAIVSGESARLARLLDDVLWTSRLNAGRVDATVVTVDAAAIAREVVETTRSHLAEGLSVEVREQGPLPLVAADPDKLRQVLVNLVENAVKYSPDGGRVEVRLEPRNRHVRFSVEDEGLGIPQEEQGRIFEKFHRLDPHMTRGIGGTGLGLFICSELVARMEGTLWVTSREGHGSTFTFELPLSGTSS